MKLSFRFSAEFRSLCNVAPSHVLAGRAAFAADVGRISRNNFPDSPVVSETTLIGENDSPPLLGPNLRENDR